MHLSLFFVPRLGSNLETRNSELEIEIELDIEIETRN